MMIDELITSGFYRAIKPYVYDRFQVLNTGSTYDWYYTVVKYVEGMGTLEFKPILIVDRKTDPEYEFEMVSPPWEDIG